ncbi:hypothetical protein OK349_04575 [Sphingomonas sp. BT-65]|uniref:hypothetical protein n=1 Tax=Sphingomonas sp. BT-65 TaxID=2989821 RepID=UPI002235E9D7|nr:hypothetical protein [Sphingomonas sp. BT-65]MCW4460971.1 hypothetical protein [Sphingomonas sp. BT-65]
MGVTPSSGEAQSTRATPAREGAATPKSETRSKFEEAMRRMRDGEAPDPGLASREGLMPFELPFVQRFSKDGGGDQGAGDHAHGTVASSSTQAIVAPAGGAVAASSPAEIASSHHEFANRISLPAQATSSESQLTMTDQRWIASHAVVRRDDAGGLSVEVQTRSDSDADQQQREALRSRLEARGHRVSSIEISRS